MTKFEKGFSLIELITVMIMLGILSVVLFSRSGSTQSAAVQGSRDDVIAAFSLAQQMAMMRPNITLVITSTSVSVNENGNPLTVPSYPVGMSSGVSLSPASTYSFDKLGRTTAGTITVTGSGVTASIAVATSGYAYAN